MAKDVRCGLSVHYMSDLSSALQNATNSGYNFIVSSLVCPRSNQFTPHSDLQLSSADWSTLVVGQMTNFDLENKTMENCTKIESEITYAVHLGLSALLFECPSSVIGITQLSRIINGRLTSSGGAQNLPFFWIEIPVHSPIESSNAWRSDLLEVESEDTWFRWQRFRSHVITDKRVGIALELNEELPDELLLDRWTGEPIKAVILPTSIFQTNRRQYPVLAKAHQMFIRKLISKMSNDINFIIKGHNRHNDIKNYIQYIDHIRNTQLPEDGIAQFARGYEDYLQIPLQPLMDNLESCTYEVFEKDPIKYQEYGKAITQALKDVKTTDQEIVIMVVGAGRGPLVEASRNSAFEVKKKVRIYAVEKNPNAIVTLKTLWDQRWGAEEGTEWAVVQVVACDMREWEAPQKADIVVSELLGSFGDNELSPECLDGVWSYVKETAISIPVSYTSYLVPIQSQRLYSEAMAQRDRSQPIYSAFETGYVVYMRNFFPIDSPKPVFTFEHNQLLLKPSQRDHTRFTSLEFKSEVDTVCHGFAGYFEAVLYGDIKISTVPTTHTPGMFSWFPIYFPIHSPVFIERQKPIKVEFWRLTNKRQIWYEWCLSEPTQTPIHNPNGRTYSIGLL